jgi:hypothetical protein
MFILKNIIQFHKLSRSDQLAKVHALQARRKELKIENKKRKIKKKRVSKTRQTKEEKMLSMMSPELRKIFLSKTQTN